LGKDIKHIHSFTARKLTVDCLPHITFVFFYLMIAEGSHVLSEVFPLLFIGLGILSLSLSLSLSILSGGKPR
jgi:hypothetical protein